MTQTFKCWNPDQFEFVDAHEFKASDHEEAAENFARWSDWNSTDYYYAKNGGEVSVVNMFDGEVKKFKVTGEQVIEYRVREVKVT